MIAASLFSGIGGFDLGFEQAGISCSVQVEIDKQARKVLARHFPNARQLEDVTTVTGGDLGPVDVICGGFPCQDVSVAGRRAGLAGARSGLWFEFHRIVGEARPSFVVIENVPGLLSSNGGRDFAAILYGLGDIGYCVAWRVLDSQYFGVPQRRRRVFIVGSLGDGRCAQVLFEREGSGGPARPGGQAGQDIAAPLTSRAHKGGFTDPVNDNVIAVWYSHDYNQDRIYDVEGVSPAHTAQDSNLARNIMVKDAVRRLTPTECERLQGFPDGWTGGQADTTRYRQLGNAVTVPVAKWIASRIVATEARPEQERLL